jgi:hypothetical protein
LDVAGVRPLSTAVAQEKIDEYLAIQDARPTGVGQGAADILKTWEDKVTSASQFTTVVNGCMLSWEPPNGPWNTGYIAAFWEKFKTGERKWDITLERKAGGVVVKGDMDFSQISLVVTNASSVMSLIREVVGQVMRTGSCTEEMAKAFMSLRVTWLFSAHAHELATVGIKENIEQHQRRKHMELDNIYQVRCWMQSMTVNTAGKLDPKKALDVVKYAVVLGDPLQPNYVESWMRNLLKGAAPTFENKVAAVSTSGVTRKFLEEHKAQIVHPEMNSYKKVLSRVRAVAGFHEWDLVHKMIVEEVHRRTCAHAEHPTSFQE